MTDYIMVVLAVLFLIVAEFCGWRFWDENSKL